MQLSNTLCVVVSTQLPFVSNMRAKKSLSRLCEEVQRDTLKSLIKETREEMRKGFVYDRVFLVCFCKLFQIHEGRMLQLGCIPLDSMSNIHRDSSTEADQMAALIQVCQSGNTDTCTLMRVRQQMLHFPSGLRKKVQQALHGSFHTVNQTLR